MATFTVENEAHWHALRHEHVGASESACLFNESPWLTAWQLWHQKKGDLPGIDENESMVAGRYFEPAVAGYAAEKWGIQLRKVRRYMTADDCPGMGASLDYEQIGTGALIPTEIKYSLHGDGWEYEGENLVEAPTHYLIQMQHQLACAPNAPHGQLIAYMGNGVKRMVIERREPIILALKSKITDFWASMVTGDEPEIDYLKDAAALSRLSLNVNFVDLDLSGDEDFKQWCADDMALAAEIKTLEESRTSRKTEHLERLMALARAQGADQEAEKIKATCGEFNIGLTRVSESPGTLITPEMVGTSYGGRKAFRMMRVTKPKPKAEKKTGRIIGGVPIPKPTAKTVDLSKAKPVF
jgi:putative phage-type endonuclease